MLTLFLLSYTLGAVVTYGAMFSFFQTNWYIATDEEYSCDLAKALYAGLMWPVVNVVTLIMWGRKPFQSGLKFY